MSNKTRVCLAVFLALTIGCVAMFGFGIFMVDERFLQFGGVLVIPAVFAGITTAVMGDIT